MGVAGVLGSLTLSTTERNHYEEVFDFWPSLDVRDFDEMLIEVGLLELFRVWVSDITDSGGFLPLIRVRFRFDPRDFDSYGEESSGKIWFLVTLKCLGRVYPKAESLSGIVSVGLRGIG